MDHPFDVYFQRHGYYPRLRIRSGVQRIEVEFAPGYTRIKTGPRGGEIWITRSAWMEILRRSVPIARKWKKHPDFDVPEAIAADAEFERGLLQERRQMKKHRKRDPSVYRRSRRRT